MYLTSHRAVLRQHAWVGLALAAVTLTFFLGVNYGNSFGQDDWLQFYSTCRIGSLAVSDRPFSMIILYSLCPIFKTDLRLYHAALIGFRLLSAFLVYLLIWQIAPARPLFAYACGAVSAIFIPYDSFYIVTLFQQADNIASLVLMLLALNGFVAYLHSSARWPRRAISLTFGLAMLAITPLVRETALPLLLVAPIGLVIYQRNWSPARLVGLASWIGLGSLQSLRVITLIYSPTDTYNSQTLAGFDPTRLIAAAEYQLDYGFRRVFQVLPSSAYQFHLPVIIGMGVMAAGFLCIRRLTADPVEDSGLRLAVRYFGWSLAGIAAAVLGFAAYLPTIFATSDYRVHVLSFAGESVALVGAAWAISSLVGHARWSATLKLGVLLYFTIYCLVMVNQTQADLESYAATRTNLAYFIRSLAHQIPAVKETTLLVYIENPATQERPFTAGFDFQFAIRYFYSDYATGLIPTDNVAGRWHYSDAGVFLQEPWSAPHLYNWDDTIFITRELSGQIRILDHLPERFLTAYRQSLYHPYDRIVASFISPSIAKTFPLLAGPDWQNDNALARH